MGLTLPSTLRPCTVSKRLPTTHANDAPRHRHVDQVARERPIAAFLSGVVVPAFAYGATPFDTGDGSHFTHHACGYT